MSEIQRTPTEELQADDVLGEPVFLRGRTLFARGKTLSIADIRELKKLQIETVVINEPAPIIGDSYQSDLLSKEFREQAVNTVKTVYQDFHNLNHHHSAEIRTLGTKMLEQIQGTKNLAIAVHDLRDYSNYTFQHSVNVTAISLAIGTRLGLTTEELNNLTTGGLLHDIGKMRIPLEILEKDGLLTREEFGIVRRHPEWGWDLLNQRDELPAVVWSIARQHHETLDGKGYPDNLVGSAIHDLSRIVTVVDMWDALRSERPYKPAWNPDKILELLNGISMVGKLDLQILEIFNDLIVPYPLGSRVMITGGRTAIVAGMNLAEFSRPILRLEVDSAGAYLDLTERRSIEVIETLELAG